MMNLCQAEPTTDQAPLANLPADLATMSEEMAETKPKVEEPSAAISIKVKDQDGGEVRPGQPTL